MEKVRINKILANLGIGSRREIDKLVNEKKIKINGKIIESGEKISYDDIVEINGKIIKLEKKEEKKYFLLNKPVGIISASKDDRGRKTVIDLVKTSKRIYPVGRLDYNTEGLIILTDDGELFNRIIHPRKEVYKTYVAEVSGFLRDENIEKLRKGIPLEEGMTLEAQVNLLSRSKIKSIIEIAIREGRNRQIRRMLEFVGNRVDKLKRIKIGELSIEGLEIGSYRELTPREVEYLYSLGK